MLAENYLQRFGRPIEVELPGGNFTAASGTVPLGHILHTTKITSTDNITRNHAVLNLWFPTFLDFLDPIFTPQISCEPRDIVSLTETLFVFHYHVYSWASWSLQGWKTIQTKITKWWWKRGDVDDLLNLVRPDVPRLAYKSTFEEESPETIIKHFVQDSTRGQATIVCPPELRGATLAVLQTRQRGWISAWTYGTATSTSCSGVAIP